MKNVLSFMSSEVNNYMYLICKLVVYNIYPVWRLGIRDINALQKDCKSKHSECPLEKSEFHHTVNDVHYIITKIFRKKEII